MMAPVYLSQSQNQMDARSVVAVAQKPAYTRRKIKTSTQRANKYMKSHALDSTCTVAPVESWLSSLMMESSTLGTPTLQLGKYEMDTWYTSLYPINPAAENGSVEDSKLYICENCLSYMYSRRNLEAHHLQCDSTKPPGKLFYKEGKVNVFEVDGKANLLYCQNLCLLAKLFMEQKTLYYDVDPFFFYIVCEKDPNGYHPVGYFSKEKESPEGYNLSCIVVFPPYQKLGYGQLMISLSYEMSMKEKTVGSPEKPLSLLGKKSYLGYWKYILLQHLIADADEVSIEDISQRTGVQIDDLLVAAQELGYIQNSSSLATNASSLAISLSRHEIEQDFRNLATPRLCNPRCVRYVPRKCGKKSGSK